MLWACESAFCSMLLHLLLFPSVGEQMVHTSFSHLLEDIYRAFHNVKYFTWRPEQCRSLAGVTWWLWLYSYCERFLTFIRTKNFTQCSLAAVITLYTQHIYWNLDKLPLVCSLCGGEKEPDLKWTLVCRMDYVGHIIIITMYLLTLINRCCYISRYNQNGLMMVASRIIFFALPFLATNRKSIYLVKKKNQI